jgi:hypothetical protein
MFWVYFQVIVAFCIFIGIVLWTVPKAKKPPPDPPQIEKKPDDPPT